METFTLEVILQVSSLAILFVQGLFMWLLWSLRREFVRRTDCEQCMNGLGVRVGETKNRLQTVELKVESMPKISAVHEIMLAIEEVKGEQKALTERIAGLSEILRRLEHPLDLLTQHHIKDSIR